MNDKAWQRKQAARRDRVQQIIRAEKRCDTKHFTRRVEPEAADARREGTPAQDRAA